MRLPVPGEYLEDIYLATHHRRWWSRSKHGCLIKPCPFHTQQENKDEEEDSRPVRRR